MIEWMFDIGVYFAMAALVFLIIGFTLSFTHPVKFINKRPTLPVKWFIAGFAMFFISFVWMFSAM